MAKESKKSTCSFSSFCSNYFLCCFKSCLNRGKNRVECQEEMICGNSLNYNPKKIIPSNVEKDLVCQDLFLNNNENIKEKDKLEPKKVKTVSETMSQRPSLSKKAIVDKPLYVDSLFSVRSNEPVKAEKILLSQDEYEVLNLEELNCYQDHYSNDKSKSPKLEIFSDNPSIGVSIEPTERVKSLKNIFDKTKEANRSLEAEILKLKKQLFEKRAELDLKKTESENRITALKNEKKKLLKKMKSESETYKIYENTKNMINQQLTEAKKKFSLLESENILLREQGSDVLRINIFERHQKVVGDYDCKKKDLKFL